MRTANAIRAVLEEALANGVAVVGESLGTLRGRPGAIEVPVADRAAVAFATGLAIGGKTAVLELSAAGRLPAVLEALGEAASVASAGEFAVPLIVRVPYGAEAGDRVDRPVGDLLAGVPGLIVACGSTGGAVVSLLKAALSASRPVVLLEPRALTDAEPDDVSLDRARVVRSGEHVTLAAVGAGVAIASEAADRLAAEGISAEVVDLVALAPIDRATLGESVRKTGRIVAVHADDGGLAERILRVSLDEAFVYLESPPAAARQDVESVARAARDGVSY